MFAAQYAATPNIIMELIEYGADTNAEDDFGRTFLWHLKENKEKEQMKEIAMYFSNCYRDKNRNNIKDENASRIVRNSRKKNKDELKMQIDQYGDAYVETKSDWTRTEKEYCPEDENLSDTYDDFNPDY